MLLFFLIFSFTISLTLGVIGVNCNKYFGSIKNVYNVSRNMVVSNDTRKDISFNNDDEKIIYDYFDKLHSDYNESNEMSYENFKKDYLNSNFYKNIEISRNSINSYYDTEKGNIDKVKNRFNKNTFLKYLSDNNVSDNVIVYLYDMLDDVLIDSKTIDDKLKNDEKQFNDLRAYTEYLYTEKDNWHFTSGNIVSKNDTLISYINNKNDEYGIDIKVIKSEPQVASNTNKVVSQTPKTVTSVQEDTSKRIPVLMYHGVSNETWGIAGLFMKVNDFDKQMKYISENFETIFIEDIEKDHSNKKVVALTFDDGYVDFYTNAFPILKKYNLKANLYVILNYKNEKYLNSNQIKEIADSGLVSVGSHTKSHVSLKELTDEELEEELKGSKEELESMIGKKVKTICYPMGLYNSKVMKVSAKYYDYGLAIINDVERLNNKFNKYAIKRFRIYRNTSFDDFKSKVNMAN